MIFLYFRYFQKMPLILIFEPSTQHNSDIDLHDKGAPSDKILLTEYQPQNIAPSVNSERRVFFNSCGLFCFGATSVSAFLTRY